MKRKLIQTSDGSSTILVEEWGESFHSVHGAIQEAQHVYIENGLRFAFQGKKETLEILEIGFGTGLNCFMSFMEAQKNNQKINYTAIEGFPLLKDEWSLLNYPSFFENKHQNIFNIMHDSPWERTCEIQNNFTLTKLEQMFENLDLEKRFDLVYFDAFGFQYQPHLWSENVFTRVKNAMNPNGVLVTYACKGEVNRLLKKLGFIIQKLEGPPGKREMIRAVLI